LYPEDKITPGSFFRNESDLQLFTNNFYVSTMPSATDIYQDEADIIINPALNTLSAVRELFLRQVVAGLGLL
jgi:hypothetical protein